MQVFHLNVTEIGMVTLSETVLCLRDTYINSVLDDYHEGFVSVCAFKGLNMECMIKEQFLFAICQLSWISRQDIISDKQIWTIDNVYINITETWSSPGAHPR